MKLSSKGYKGESYRVLQLQKFTVGQKDGSAGKGTCLQG